MGRKGFHVADTFVSCLSIRLRINCLLLKLRLIAGAGINATVLDKD